MPVITEHTELTVQLISQQSSASDLAVHAQTFLDGWRGKKIQYEGIPATVPPTLLANHRSLRAPLRISYSPRLMEISSSECQNLTAVLLRILKVG